MAAPGEVSTEIADITKVAKKTGLAANNLLDSAQDLGRQSEKFSGQADSVLPAIRKL